MSHNKFQLFIVFDATSLNYFDYLYMLFDFKTNGKNSSRIDYFSCSSHLYDYIPTFNFFKNVKNTNKEMMFENFKKYLGNNYYMKD